jgi:hypothetical protein
LSPIGSYSNGRCLPHDDILALPNPHDSILSSRGRFQLQSLPYVLGDDGAPAFAQDRLSKTRFKGSSADNDLVALLCPQQLLSSLGIKPQVQYLHRFFWNRSPPSAAQNRRSENLCFQSVKHEKSRLLNPQFGSFRNELGWNPDLEPIQGRARQGPPFLA